MGEKDLVVVIIPTYNEKENVGKIIKEITFQFKKENINGKIIVVDDNSPDGTGELADKFSKKYSVIVMHRTKDKGYGNSIISGFKKALKMNSDIIITMDADFSHNPADIPRMIKEIKDADVVIGSRRIEGGRIENWSIWRHFCSKSAMLFSKFMIGLKTKDPTSGFRAYKSNVFKKVFLNNIKSNGYSFLEELLYLIELNNFRVKEIPIIFSDRKYGKSKLSNAEILKFFITILRLKLKLIISRYKLLSRFLIVGLSGIFVNMFFLWFLKSGLNLGLEISSLIAIEISILTNFIFNNSWTFRGIGKNSLLSKIGKYHVSVLFGVLINWMVVIVLTNNFGVFYLISNIIGIICATANNYILSSRWAWRN